MQSRRLVAFAAVLGSLAPAGCGSGSKAVDSGVRQSAAAACLQGVTAIKDRAVRKSAEQACRAVGTGNTRQLTNVAKKGAREACQVASEKISNPTARAAAKSACPAIK